MSNFHVKKSAMDAAGGQMDNVSRKIISLKNQIEAVVRKMNMKSSGYDRVRRNLNAAVSALNSKTEKVRYLSKALEQITNEYVNTENRIIGNSEATGTTIGKMLENIRNQIEDVKGSLGMDSAAVFSSDPVNLGNGNYVYEKNFFDYDTPMPLTFRMFYNACGSINGSLGKGWRHSFEKFIVIEKDTISFINEDASAQIFRNGDEGYQAVHGAVGSLEKIKDGYKYTNDEHEYYFFSNEGKLIREETIDGWCIDLSYDGDKVKHVSCTDGIGISFAYDEDGHLVGLEDNTGRKVKFRYVDGNLTELTDPNGYITAYEYDEKNRLTRIISPTGDLSVQNTYDDLGRTLQQRFADGGTVTYQYDDANQSIVMRRQNGSEVVYYHDTLYRNTRTVYPVGEENIEYNSENKRVSFTDRLGRKSRYAYDAGGRLEAFTNPSGSQLTFGYNQRGQLNEVAIDGELLGKAEYDDKGHQIRHTDANGAAVEFEYDKLGRVISVKHEDDSVTSLLYDESGNVISVNDPVTGTTKYEYDKAKHVICSIDALDHETHYEYDAMDQLTKVTNAEGKSRNYEYDARGNLVKVKDFNGGEIAVRYNSMNKPVEIKDADGNITTFEYDLMSNVVAKKAADGGITEYTYDTEGRITSIKHPMGGIEKAEYDAVGNLTRRIDASGGEFVLAYDELDRPVSVTDPVKGTRTAVYDKLGNVTDIHYEDGTSEHFTFDLEGNRLSHTNQTGYTRNFKYNSLRMITEISDSQGVIATFTYGAGGQLLAEKHMDGASLAYQYDTAGNVIDVADSIRGKWKFQYDSLNRVVRAEHVGSGVESYEYDAIGNICAVIDGEGNKTTYEYSKAGALLKVTDPLGNETGYQYDPCYRLKEILQPESGHFDAAALNEFNKEQQVRTTSYQWDLDGNMVAMTDSGSGSMEFSYDGCGRIISRKDQEGNSTSCTYRADGTEDVLRFADGRTVQYEYDALKRLVQIEDWLGITRIERDAAGRIVEVTEHDGKHTTYEWDERGKCIQLAYPDGSSVKYGYDAFGRLAHSRVGDAQIAYDYFDNGQLRSRSFNDGTHTDYEYDIAGRVSSLTHHRESGEIARFTYEYDACERKSRIVEKLTGGPESDYTFKYDPRGSLERVLRNGSLMQSFEYDVFGNRSKMTANGQETLYSYDNLNRLQCRSTNGEKHTYTYDRRGNLTGESVNGVKKLTMHFDALNRLTRAASEAGEAEYQYNGMAMLSKVSCVMGGANKETRYLFDYADTQNRLLASSCDDKWEDYVWDTQLVAAKNADVQTILLMDERMSNRAALDGAATRVFAYDAFGGFGDDPAPRSGFGFSGYRYDPITGYYDAGWRQYDPTNGRFISQDPIAGGLMTPITLNPYLYCLSDPVNIVDPTGMIVAWLAGGIVGAVVNVGTKFAGDVVNSVKNGKWTGSSWESYVGAAAGGFVQGSVFVVAGPAAAGAAGAVTETLVTNGLSMITGREGYRKEDGYGIGRLAGDTIVSGVKGAAAGFTWGAAAKYLKIPGITSGRGSMVAVWKQVMTKAQRGIIANVTMKTLGKGLLSYGVVKTADTIISKGISTVKEEAKKFVKNKAIDLIKYISNKDTAGVNGIAPTSLCGVLGGAKAATCATA